MNSARPAKRNMRNPAIVTFLALFALSAAATVAGEPSAPRQSPIVAIPDYLQTNEVVSAKRSITETLLAAGAVPVVLPEMDDAAADRILSFCDAVLVGGGIAMQDYDRRCAFEDRVIALAANRGLTIVGICHGCEVVNRHFGGTLSPVPEGRKTVHNDNALFARTGQRAEHFVTVLPGDSLMSRVFGEGRLKVNSSHSLRCETVAPGFRATALSEGDGVVEAFEHETLPILGFQFHPEYYWGEHPKFLELVKAVLAEGKEITSVAAAPGYDLANGVASVTLSLLGASRAPAGAMVRMTVTERGGAILGHADLPCAGAGEYAFDTAAVAGLDLSGAFDYTLSFSLVDAAGEALPFESGAEPCELRLASYAPWFAADAATGAATGGAWASGGAGGPPAESGAWRIAPDAVFSADEPRSGVARFEIALENDSGFDEDDLPALLSAAVAARARGAMLQVLEDEDTCTWRGLVVEDGSPAWKRLYGPDIPAGQPRVAYAEIDLAGATPLVSYLVAGGAGASTIRLRDASGETWFATSGSSAALDGRVELRGEGGVSALAGTTLDKAVAETGGVRYGSLADALRVAGLGGTVALLANATAPASLLAGRTVIDNGWELMAMPDPRKETCVILQ